MWKKWTKCPVNSRGEVDTSAKGTSPLPEQLKPVEEDVRKAQQIVEDLAQGNRTTVITELRQLAEKSKEFPKKWLKETAQALETEDWSGLRDGFVNHKFVGVNGYFLIIGPYVVCREAEQLTELTAIVGRVISVDMPSIETLKAILEKESSPLHQAIPIILPYEPLAACGNVVGERGEAFAVANNWKLPDSIKGPSLNNMAEQRRRFQNSGIECIRRIWVPDSAELLLSPLVDENTGTRYRSLEYQLHEYGHSSGLGLERKVQENLFGDDYWKATVEESRSDGVELELAVRVLSEEEAGKVTAVNFCVRQALDAHRRGGLNRDADVGASLHNFALLWESGEIGIKSGRLYLKDVSYRGLLRAAKPHREWAMSLTRKELALDHPKGLFRLYGSVAIHPAVEEIFKGLIVEPCLGLFRELR